MTARVLKRLNTIGPAIRVHGFDPRSRPAELTSGFIAPHSILRIVVVPSLTSLDVFTCREVHVSCHFPNKRIHQNESPRKKKSIPSFSSSLMSISEKYVSSAFVIVATTIAVIALRKKWGSKHSLPYPPGPKGYPIIGNALDFPANPIWEGFAKMGQEYSEFSLVLFGRFF